MEIIWESIDGVGIRETDGDADGTKDGGADDNVGLNVMDGTADGTPRFGSHGMSIFHGS